MAELLIPDYRIITKRGRALYRVQVKRTWWRLTWWETVKHRGKVVDYFTQTGASEALDYIRANWITNNRERLWEVQKNVRGN